MLVITIHSLTGNATPIFVTKIFLDQIFGSELWSREVNTGTGMLISFCQCCAREVYDISLIFYSLLYVFIAKVDVLLFFSRYF